MKLLRIPVILFSVLGLILFFVLGTLFIVFRGPSPTARDMLTLSMLESSAAKFVPKIYLSHAFVDKIVELNSLANTSEITDASLFSMETRDQEQDDEWADCPDGIRLTKI